MSNGAEATFEMVANDVSAPAAGAASAVQIGNTVGQFTYVWPLVDQEAGVETNITHAEAVIFVKTPDTEGLNFDQANQLQDRQYVRKGDPGDKPDIAVPWVQTFAVVPGRVYKGIIRSNDHELVAPPEPPV